MESKIGGFYLVRSFGEIWGYYSEVVPLVERFMLLVAPEPTRLLRRTMGNMYAMSAQTVRTKLYMRGQLVNLRSVQKVQEEEQS